MLLPYLALVQMTDKTSRFIPVAAENPEQALSIAIQLCLERNEEGATILSVFGEEDVTQAHDLIQAIHEEIKAASSTTD